MATLGHKHVCDKLKKEILDHNKKEMLVLRYIEVKDFAIIGIKIGENNLM